MTALQVAYLVLGEPGVDAGPLLESFPAGAERFYAPPPGRGAAADPTRTPSGVDAAGAPAGEAAIARVRARTPDRALFVVNAGERPRPGSAAETWAECGRDALLPVAIPLAGGAVRHAPWFHGRRARLVVPGGAARAGSRPRAAPRGDALVRPLGSLAEVLAGLIRSAASEPLPAGRAGSARILLEPALCGARVLAAGAWRDGPRGGLFAALHALHRLVLLARTWAEDDGARLAGERP